jgi:isoquinoline 1-oxidoreductase beta subunit
MDGGFIGIMLEAAMEGNRVKVKSVSVVADVGDQPHPDIARQQIEGGIVFGIAGATGCMVDYANGLPTRAIIGRMGLPRRADIGEINIELLPGTDAPAGVGQIGVPPVGPALAGALFTLTGKRHRTLPLVRPS